MSKKIDLFFCGLMLFGASFLDPRVLIHAFAALGLLTFSVMGLGRQN